MKNVFDELKERGLVKQTVFEDDLRELFGSQKVNFYVGFDPTADSLHVGHFTTLMMASRLQKAGHKPYLLVGGGTAMIGDPSGRTDMRPMMTKETINHNIECFKKQMSKFVSFEGENAAVIVNNADWLLNLNYVDFIREVGSVMSVNRMLSFECFKKRLEKGLSFLELNYMPMQAYDFYHLFKEHNVQVEVGGDDQWANILAGADFIRRKLEKPAFALTFPLLARADGQKMGKTAGGAVWLDPNKTTPFEMYQFFRNTDDSLVDQQLRMLTFVPTEKIKELTEFKDERINKAKEVLAYEVVKLVHGEEIANEVLKQVTASFSNNVDDMPVEKVMLAEITTILDLIMQKCGVNSKSDARRLIDGKSIRINDRLVTDYYDEIPEKKDNSFVFHKGKKIHIKVEVND